jgi:hypothetical protein
LIAGFIAMVFLVPFEAIHLKVNLPVSSDLDRFFVVVLVGAWAIAGLIGRGSGVMRFRAPGWAAGVIVFVSVAIASIAVNIDRITNLGEWEVAQKRLAVLLALVAVFVIVSLTLRVVELRPFAVLIVILATITAAGTIYEQKTGYNVFYSLAATVFSPIATVDPAPTYISPDPDLPARPLITGPTRHGLSVASILGMALPFAVVLSAMAPTTRRRLLWVLAASLIAAGALVTQRKSGAVVPAFALLVLFVLRPRQLLRLAPYGIVAIVLGLVMSGGSFSSIELLKQAKGGESTVGRTSDYPAIVPDLLTTPLLGRGYGTLNSERSDTYRIFDNEYLGQVYQVGALGLVAFLALIVTPLLVVRRVLRSDNPLRAPPALAAGAGCLAFGVAAALYDILSFSQAPYLFLILSALCTCAVCVEVPVDRRLRPMGVERVPLPVDA